jgi:hypothetical protein
MPWHTSTRRPIWPTSSTADVNQKVPIGNTSVRLVADACGADDLHAVGLGTGYFVGYGYPRRRAASSAASWP